MPKLNTWNYPFPLFVFCIHHVGIKCEFTMLIQCISAFIYAIQIHTSGKIAILLSVKETKSGLKEIEN